MSDYVDPEIADAYKRLNDTNKALVAAWVLLGRCDAALEMLDDTPRGPDRRRIINKMRAEILHAMGSTQ